MHSAAPQRHDIPTKVPRISDVCNQNEAVTFYQQLVVVLLLIEVKYKLPFPKMKKKVSNGSLLETVQ